MSIFGNRPHNGISFGHNIKNPSKVGWWMEFGEPADNARIVELTPDLAAMWMELNTSNRKVNPQTVDRYARDIAAGRWQVNGEPIIFDRKRVLRNGQHRCLAVIKSGVSILVYVIFDVDEGAFMTMDGGRKRTAADQLGVLKEKHAAPVAAAVRLIVSYETGAYDYYPTTPEIIEALNGRHSKIRDSISAGVSVGHLMPPSAGIATGYITSTIDKELSESFMSQFASGADLSDGHPVLALRDKIFRVKGDRSGNGRQSHHLQIRSYLYLQWAAFAWNALREGRSIKQIRDQRKFIEFK